MPLDPDEAIEKMYYHEFDRRRALYSQLSIPSAALTVLGGLLAYLLRNFKPYEPDVLTTLFVIFALLAFLAFVAAAYSAFQSLRVETGSKPVDVDRLNDMATETMPPATISRELANAMAAATSKTREQNDKRQDCLFDVYEMLMITTGLLLIASVLFGLRILT